MTEDSALHLQPTYLLHRRPYSNSSLLVECLTLQYGRFPAIAKGVLSGRRPSAGLLQPFIPLQLKWSGRGEVKSITGFEQGGRAPNLRGRSLYCGFYLNELLVRLMGRHDPHERLFGYYAEVLSQLAEEREMANINRLLRRFEILMLGELGYELVLDHDADSGMPVSPGSRYDYHVETGPILSPRREQGMVSGATLLALAQGDPLDGEGLREARHLTRHLLAHYLGDKPLKSRELFHNTFLLKS